MIGYSAPGWRAASVPIDETHPVHPANAYALSKLVIEETVRMFSRTAPGAFGFFRPCYVISPEEWAGAPTQQGHTIAERLADPALAAVSLFNYLDARDAAAFVDAWLAAPAGRRSTARGTSSAPRTRSRPGRSPSCGASTRLRSATAADALEGTRPVFSIDKAAERLGWRPERDWRGELAAASAMQTESRAS